MSVPALPTALARRIGVGLVTGAAAGLSPEQLREHVAAAEAHHQSVTKVTPRCAEWPVLPQGTAPPQRLEYGASALRIHTRAPAESRAAVLEAVRTNTHL